MLNRSPHIDPGARQRLTARFGGEVGAWFERLPGMLAALGDRWHLAFEAPIPRGSVSVVFRCRMDDGRSAVLKASPDRERVAYEAAALERWQSAHVPVVLALDAPLGALLLESIEPGTPLDVSAAYPDLTAVAELVRALHLSGVPDRSYPTVGQRVADLFDSSAKLYERHRGLSTVISTALYEHGRRLAVSLARDTSPNVLLHGDLTPSNILDGGERGLVAIDPSPCLGDAGFDMVDLSLWHADDLETVVARTRRLAVDTRADPERLLGWCIAFAGMAALELASRGDRGMHLDVLREVAALTPTAR